MYRFSGILTLVPTAWRNSGSGGTEKSLRVIGTAIPGNPATPSRKTRYDGFRMIAASVDPAGRDFNEFGQIEDEIGYLPYRKLDLAHGGAESDVGTTHLFTGHERDSGEGSSGLDYMHQRYYSPVLARFVSIDPVAGSVESSQSWNRYSYVLGNPVKLVDPDGED